MFAEHGFRVLGVTILLIIATTYVVLTMLSDFPELAHLILTKILLNTALLLSLILQTRKLWP